MFERATFCWRGLAVIACAVFIACSAGADTSPEPHAFADDAGRSCTATLEKTSPTARSVSQSVACDGEGRQCSKESNPCFQLTVNAETKQIENCPACCRGTATSYNSADCSALICETDVDCVYSRAQCVGGACVCPNGICE